MQFKNRIVRTSDTILFLGHVKDNLPHKHYAIQITISLSENLIEITQGEDLFRAKALLTPSLTPHQLITSDSPLLLLLINPASKKGHYFKHFAKSIASLHTGWVEQLQSCLRDLFNNTISIDQFKEHYSTLIDTETTTSTSHFQLDSRIETALSILHSEPDTIFPMEEIADKVALSPGRFIHLFKEETGISYRRMQLWIKLNSTFDHLPQTNSLTELAHQSGFSDSAHFSRTFKETFGLSPSSIIKNSQFIQF